MVAEGHARRSGQEGWLDEDTAAASTLLSEMLAGAGVGHTLQEGRILLE